MFDRVNAEKDLKVISCEVPDKILPSGIKGELYDCRIGGRGPDDKIYNKNEFIRENVFWYLFITNILLINITDYLGYSRNDILQVNQWFWNKFWFISLC